MRLKRKIAIVTGGGTGIGRATSLLFAQEGAHVVVVGRRESRLLETVNDIKERGGSAHLIPGDISKVSETERIVKEAVEQFGGLDILVNNAGVYRGARISEITEDDYDYIMDINLKGTFFMCKHAISEMKKRGRGAIINVGSALGIKGWKDASTSVYSASKGGVAMLTKALALEVAKDQIRVNCVCPAIVETEVLETLGIPKHEVPELLKQWNSFHPLGRNGQPEDVARAVLYFASDDSSWATGSVLNLDGGVTAAQVIHTRWEPE
jgi:NAD(P)-dependent dehydrogenase (short-subunit alcohol dehydrogenase family)